MSTARKVLRGTAALLVVGLGAIQFIPVDRSNPPAGTQLVVPSDVATILRTSCFDCHSNETTWPWYSRVAPASFLIAHDVHEGREHLNFSEWNHLSPDEQSEAREEIAEHVEEGEMPPWFYVPLHRGAALTPGEREALTRWASRGAEHDERR